MLGPPDGRYLVRSAPDALVEGVLVLGTDGAPPRQRKAREIEEAGREPVPTTRATTVRPAPFRSSDEAADWLAGLRGDDEAVEAELAGALAVLNRALSAWRAARADPYVQELSFDRALVARIGYGGGDALADGRYAAALELPRPGARAVKRSMEAPEERFAALLGAREQQLVAEELVLRARADLDAGRPREAALQARVALEALIAERGALAEHRGAVGEAANEALRGELSAASLQAVMEAVKGMEGALRRHRLGG
jgi:hypothetical protein